MNSITFYIIILYDITEKHWKCNNAVVTTWYTFALPVNDLGRQRLDVTSTDHRRRPVRPRTPTQRRPATVAQRRRAAAAGTSTSAVGRRDGDQQAARGGGAEEPGAAVSHRRGDRSATQVVVVAGRRPRPVSAQSRQQRLQLRVWTGGRDVLLRPVRLYHWLLQRRALYS